MAQTVPAPEAGQLLHPPAEAAAMLGVSRTSIYKLIKDGQLESVQIGSKILVPAAGLVAYVERLRGHGSA
jgi:excisionase family DNA binding protein